MRFSWLGGLAERFGVDSIEGGKPRDGSAYSRFDLSLHIGEDHFRIGDRLRTCGHGSLHRALGRSMDGSHVSSSDAPGSQALELAAPVGIVVASRCPGMDNVGMATHRPVI